MSERQWVGYKWIKKGPYIVYFGSDLQKIMDGVTDYLLFKKTLESEMEFRKVEGRFASEQDEYTILRFRPVLNFSSSLKYANLRFQYGDKLSVKSNDTRKVFFDLANGFEIQRNSSLEDKYINFLEQAGAQYRPSKNGDWFFPALNLDRILKKLNEKGFKLQIKHKALASLIVTM